VEATVDARAVAALKLLVGWVAFEMPCFAPDHSHSLSFGRHPQTPSKPRLTAAQIRQDSDNCTATKAKAMLYRMQLALFHSIGSSNISLRRCNGTRVTHRVSIKSKPEVAISSDNQATSS
jgi:hypothetical protein